MATETTGRYYQAFVGKALLVLLGCLAGLTLAACGGSGTDSTVPDVQPPAAADDGAFSPPRPSAFRGVSYLPADLVRTGAEYVDPGVFPCQRIQVNADQCTFDPSWLPGVAQSGGLAYACYSFDLEDYDLVQAINFSWRVLPAPTDLWIGLADYSRDSWRWYQPSAGLRLETNLTGHVDPITQQLRVLVVCTGTDLCELDWIQVGDLATVDGYVYQADGTTPLYEAEVFVNGGQDYAVRTDWEGHWAVIGVAPGDYDVSARLVGWSCTPASQAISVASENVQAADIIGTELPASTVTGEVRDGTPSGLGGVQLEFRPQDGSGGSVKTWTEFNGQWQYELPDGEFTVEPSLPGWSFTPSTRTFTVAGAGLVVDQFLGERLPGYTVEGNVYGPDGFTGLANIQITLSGNELYFYTPTDNAGHWLVADVPDGTYTVEPFQFGLTFTPASRQATVAGGNLTVESFIGAEPALVDIDGYIYLEDGETPLPGVQVQFNGEFAWESVQTDSSGHYLIEDMYAGEYDIVPIDIRYLYTPEERTVIANFDTTVKPFLATPRPLYNLDGYVMQGDGTTPVVDAEVTVWAYVPPGTSFTAYTDAAGHWTVSGVAPYVYWVSPEKQGYTFEPYDTQITVEDHDITVDTFIGTSLQSYRLDGYVYELDGTTPVPGIPIGISGRQFQFNATTDATGYWVVEEAFEDTYTVRPMRAPWVFTPPSREAVVSGGNLRVPDFLGEELTGYTVEGYVYETGTTTPVPDVQVIFDDGINFYICATDTAGHYALPIPNGHWDVMPTASCWAFEPAYRSITVSSAPLMLDEFYASPGG